MAKFYDYEQDLIELQALYQRLNDQFDSLCEDDSNYTREYEVLEFLIQDVQMDLEDIKTTIINNLEFGGAHY